MACIYPSEDAQNSAGEDQHYLPSDNCADNANISHGGDKHKSPGNTGRSSSSKITLIELPEHSFHWRHLRIDICNLKPLDCI